MRAQASPKRSGQKKNKVRDTITGYLFLLPALIGFILFIGGPLVVALILVFIDYNLIQPPEYIGFENIIRLFQDTNMPVVTTNTLKFLLILPLIHCVGALILAYLVSRVRFNALKSLFRGVIYFPAIVTTASVAIAWGYMFATDTGLINYYLRQLGFSNVPWLTDPTVAYATIAIFSFWKFVGTTFLYYIIGLSNIPEVYYEAAEIDGAGSVHIFTHITLPLLSPTIFFVVITNLIGVFQIFDEPYLLTNGGPGMSTKTLSVYIYETAFKSMNIGYGATISFALFIVILILTIFQFAIQKKWVVYDYS